MAGSCAARGREPRQVRKEAAVSGYFRVPQGSLAGASATWALQGAGSKERHGLFSSALIGLPDAIVT